MVGLVARGEDAASTGALVAAKHGGCSSVNCTGSGNGAFHGNAPTGEFGGGRYLSLLDVIVVNDGSTDRTSEIAHDFARRYPGVVRVIDKPNGHYGSCINAALPVAQGEYVKVLDADDTFEPEALARFLRFIEETKRWSEPVDLILSDVVQVDPKGAVVRDKKISAPVGCLLKDARAWENLSHDAIMMHTIAYARRLFGKFEYRQTEGICYTDNEWAFLPMAYVRTFASSGLSLYLYLVGREGQSMDPAVQARNTEMMRKVTSRCLLWTKEHLADCSQSNREFVLNSMRQMMWSTYGFVFANVGLSRVDGILRELDRMFGEIDPVGYADTRNFKILKSTRLAVDYLSCWRRHKTVGLWVLGLVRLYSRFMNRLARRRS